MAKLTKGQQRTLKNNNPKLKFNLKDIFGVDLKGKEELRLAMAQALLDKMLDKTAGGKSRTGRKFKKYSKKYIESEDFKASGKSPSKVNLNLSGDMLGLVDVVGGKTNIVTLGWEDGEEAAKAHGHITGNKATNLPVRDFFGLNNKDIKELKTEFAGEIADIKTSKASFADRAILALIKKIDGES